MVRSPGDQLSAFHRSVYGSKPDEKNPHRGKSKKNRNLGGPQGGNPTVPKRTWASPRGEPGKKEHPEGGSPPGGGGGGGVVEAPEA